MLFDHSLTDSLSFQLFDLTKRAAINICVYIGPFPPYFLSLVYRLYSGIAFLSFKMNALCCDNWLFLGNCLNLNVAHICVTCVYIVIIY